MTGDVIALASRGGKVFMRIVKGSLLSAMAVFAHALPALGADPAARPPVITAESVTPEDTSSGWYLRGDIGVAVNIPAAINWNSLNETNRKQASNAVGGLGIGYRFNESFRTDLTFDFMSAHKLSGNLSATTQDRLNQQSIALMANGYYDVLKYSGLTPYIGAGIGIAQVNTDSIGRDISGLTTYTFGKSTGYAFTAAAMTGIAIDIGHGLQADLGYRMAWIGHSRTGTEPTGTLAGPINVSDYVSHQFRVGLRYLIN